jgi:hypothetical protein
MSNLVHNERVRLRANFWNNLGTVFGITLGLTPALASVDKLGVSLNNTIAKEVFIGIAIAQLFVFRAQALKTLGELKDD